jgi:hypothetical protein
MDFSVAHLFLSDKQPRDGESLKPHIFQIAQDTVNG